MKKTLKNNNKSPNITTNIVSNKQKYEEIYIFTYLSYLLFLNPYLSEKNQKRFSDDE